MPLITIDNPTRAQLMAAAPNSEVTTVAGDRYRVNLSSGWRLLGKNGRPRANVESKASIDFVAEGCPADRAVTLHAYLTPLDQLALGCCYRGEDLRDRTFGELTHTQRAKLCNYLRALGLVHPNKWAIIDPPPKPAATQLMLMQRAADTRAGRSGWLVLEAAEHRAARRFGYLHVERTDGDVGHYICRLTDAGAEWLIRYDGYELVRADDGSWQTPEA